MSRRPGGDRTRRQQRDQDPPGEGRFRSRRERSFDLPASIGQELREVAAPKAASDLERRLAIAAQYYERDRYNDALQAVRPVVVAAPQSAAARELYGLTLYRLGRWRRAARELRQVHQMTGTFDQHPVIADCERAMGHPDRVRQLWDEMRREGVDQEILIEGRLVMAGALADSGDTVAAIKLLEPAAKVRRRRPDVPLLREWYTLANLYEVAGDLPRARELFQRVATVAPDLFDAPERLRAIR